jgi:hypothetical protein
MITGSCGHSVQHLSHLWSCSVRDYTRDNNRCVYYVSVCKACYDQYEKDNIILYTETDENNWLGVE